MNNEEEAESRKGKLHERSSKKNKTSKKDGLGNHASHVLAWPLLVGRHSVPTWEVAIGGHLAGRQAQNLQKKNPEGAGRSDAVPIIARYSADIKNFV